MRVEKFVLLVAAVALWGCPSGVQVEFENGDPGEQEDMNSGETPQDMGSGGEEDQGQAGDPDQGTTQPDPDMGAVDPPEDMGGGEEMDMGGEEEDMAPAASRVPARYPTDRLLSPINEHVADNMRAIRQRSPGFDETVFMKVGDSNTVSASMMHCFSTTSSYTVDLAGRTELQDTIDYFNMTQIGGATSFDRESLSAKIGRTASWSLDGSPSPVAQEIDVMSPRFALVSYGTNDMQMGATHYSALFPFYQSMAALLDELMGQGIIPIVTGLPPRGDSEEAMRWARIYNDVTRGMAEARQVPYIDLLRATVDLPDRGLVSDGLHGSAYSDGVQYQPCVFTEEALARGFNVRNLLTIQMLDTVRHTVLEEQPAPDLEVETWSGDGSPTDPFVITSLPFSHAADTSNSPHSNIDEYPGCGDGLNEAGAEYTYVLELDEPTSVRALVLDGAGVDIDLHLLGADGAATSCVDRNDKMIEADLPAGRHVFSLDTFVTRSGGPQPGPYLFVLLPEPNVP